MVDGFWVVQFQGIQGNGGGVAILIKGRVLGGDSAYTYEGPYELRGDSLTAKIQVHNFLNGVPNVLGITGNFELIVEGKLTGNVILGKASVGGKSVPGLLVKLTKRADLP